MLSPLLLVTAIVVLGIGAQWLAWRFRLPSILLLLVFGFVAGPVAGVIPREALGSWVPSFVSFAVGFILFEGGLSLRISELREVGRSVLNLITIGVVATGVLATLGAHYLAGFSWEVSLVVGALLTVTGPTVVIPLLNHVRPTGRVGTISKWEGITIDPVGAILAVLVLEAVILVHEPAATAGAGGVFWVLAKGLLLEIIVGVGVGAVAAFCLFQLLYRRLLPDWLQNPVALVFVIAALAVANSLMDEAGLLATVLMGIFLTNQNKVHVRRIVAFKEDLNVLLLSLLFIILSARLELSTLDIALAAGPLLFLAFLIFVVRPVAVGASSLNTDLNLKEKVFLSWMAPRGVVAAAVASLFAIRLEPFFPADAARIVPVVFLVIVGTVALYGLTISPIARGLGLASPNPQGLVFIGAHDWARKIALPVAAHDFRVVLLDTNQRNVLRARKEGLEAVRTNVLAESAVENLDLARLGRLLAVTHNDEVNTLAALNFSEVFESDSIYQLALQTEAQGHAEEEISGHLRGRPLFGHEATFSSLAARFQTGAQIHEVELTETLSLDALSGENDSMLPLFLVRDDRLIVFADAAGTAQGLPGDTLLALFDDEPVLPPAPAGNERSRSAPAEGPASVDA